MGANVFDVIDIIGIILMLIGVLLLTPILLYSLYNFYSINIRSTDLIKYRNKRLVYYMNALAILSFCTERIFTIFTQVLRIPDGAISQSLCFIAVYLFVFGFYTLFLIKTWLSYYSREYHRKSVELAWCKDVDPTTSKNVSNEWFIKYKHKLGNDRFLIKIAVFPFLFFILLEIILDIMIEGSLIDDVITLSYASFIFIVSFVLYYKTLNFNDIYHIKQEMQYQTIILLFIVFISILSVLIQIIRYHDIDIICIKSTNECDIHRVEWLLSSFIGYITLFSISLISTAFPVYLYKKNINTVQMSQCIDETSTEKHHFLDGMFKIISHESGFKAFMVHLIKEYSTENMLFILELVQIKSSFQFKHNNVLKLPKSIDLNLLSMPDAKNKKVISVEKITVNFNMLPMEFKRPKTLTPKIVFEEPYSNNNTSQQRQKYTYFFNETGSIFCKLVLPLHLPQSAIINQHSADFCKQMRCLYEKYIKNNSKHELNIGYKQRVGLTNLFENDLNAHIDDEFDIFNILDEAAIEVLKLSFNSFQRFKETVSFQEVEEEINKSKSTTKHKIGISAISASFNLEAIHSEDSYDKIFALYPPTSTSLQSGQSSSTYSTPIK